MNLNLFKISDVKNDGEHNMSTAWLPARYVVCMLAFLGVTFNYILRVNINFALVAMVKHNPVTVTHTPSHTPSDAFNRFQGDVLMGPQEIVIPAIDISTHNDAVNASQGDDSLQSVYTCPAPANDTTSHTTYNGNLPWDEWTQGLVAGAFFYGNVVSQLPGGRLAELWGPCRVLGGALLSASIFTLMQPVLARVSYILLIFARIMVGLSLGVTSPANHALLSGWAPPMERSTLSAIIYAGVPAGTVVAFPVSAYIIDNLGWEAVFYIQGALTLVWCLAWFFIVTDSPASFRWITNHERNYIITSIGDTKSKKRSAVPWKAVVTSLPVWSVVAGSFGHNWGFYTLLSAVPLYTKTILHQDIKSNASVSGLPFVGMWVMSLAGGVVCDWCQQRWGTSTIAVRKTSHFFANMGPAVCVVGLMCAGCDWHLTVALLVVGVAFKGLIFSGHYISPIDLAPNFAGTLLGITNTIGNVPGFLAPMINGAIINNQQTLPQWRIVFFITAAIYVLDTVIYLVFASAEVQPWNNSQLQHPESGETREDQHSADKTTSHQRDSHLSQINDYREESENTSKHKAVFSEGNYADLKNLKRTGSNSNIREGTACEEGNHSCPDGERLQCPGRQGDSADGKSVEGATMAQFTAKTKGKGHLNPAFNINE
ncbi:sialin [Procambarus clarkii]|uniref:sialin n=1 Tax=Procambarus clarkii TaxID=6728 RepID=UPI001E678AE4|nr:sialin-like [Procambarus clarkii]